MSVWFCIINLIHVLREFHELASSYYILVCNYCQLRTELFVRRLAAVIRSSAAECGGVINPCEIISSLFDDSHYDSRNKLADVLKMSYAFPHLNAIYIYVLTVRQLGLLLILFNVFVLFLMFVSEIGPIVSDQFHTENAIRQTFFLHIIFQTKYRALAFSTTYFVVTPGLQRTVRCFCVFHMITLILYPYIQRFFDGAPRPLYQVTMYNMPMDHPGYELSQSKRRYDETSFLVDWMIQNDHWYLTT